MAAMMLPGETRPAATLFAPYHRMAAMVRFRSMFTTGLMKARVSSTFSWVWISSSLALPKRSFS